MRPITILISTVALAAAGTAFAQTSPSQKMSQAECASLWSSLDASKAGSLSEAQAKNAVPNFATADTNKDGKLSQSEFTTACGKGGVTSRGLSGNDGSSVPKTPSTK